MDIYIHYSDLPQGKALEDVVGELNEVLDEHGLIQVEQSTDHLRISVQEVSGKVDLEASKLLRHLRRLAEEA